MMNFNKKKAVILTAAIITLGALGGTAAMTTQVKQTGADTSPVVTTLQNHETRIKNAENNIKDLQVKTNTPDNASNTSVPVVTAPATTTATTQAAASPAVADTSAPVTVTAYREIVIDPDTSDCEYTYSDGTTSVFHWKTSNPQGGWMADSFGQNGHYVKTTQTSGYCDNQAIGIAKTNG